MVLIKCRIKFQLDIENNAQVEQSFNFSIQVSQSNSWTLNFLKTNISYWTPAPAEVFHEFDSVCSTVLFQHKISEYTFFYKQSKI